MTFVKNVSRYAIKIKGTRLEPWEEKEVELTQSDAEFFKEKIQIKERPTKAKR